MGAYCSIHNDTPNETIMVYIGVNTKVLQPILWSITGLATLVSSGVAWGTLPALVPLTIAADTTILVSVSTLTAMAGGLVSASQFALDKLQTQLVNDLTKGGYHKCLPGQTFSKRLSPGLNVRAWIVRIQRTDSAIILQRSNASVWSGPTPGSYNVYKVLEDKHIFAKNYHYETIPLCYENIPTEWESTTTTTKTTIPKTQYHGDDDDDDMQEQTWETNDADDKKFDSSFGKEKKMCRGETLLDDQSFTVLDSGTKQYQCQLVEQQEENVEDSIATAWLQVDAS